MNTSALSASRAADVAQKRVASTSCFAMIAAYSSTAANTRSSAASREPAGAVDALAEPDHAHLADVLDHPALVRVEVGDQELDGVGAAVDRGDPGHACPSVGPVGTHGPLAHHAPSRSSTSSPSGFDAAALGQRLAGEHVQALHPVGHAAGGDAGDLRDVADLRSRAAR